jgi:PadR family transcriptional regulator, regulatory protein PadR
MPPRALGPSTIAVLKALTSARYGLDIMTVTGLPSGTVYPTLTRMETRGYVRGVWEKDGTAEREGRPRRRYYELTATGLRALGDALQQMNALARIPKPLAAKLP